MWTTARRVVGALLLVICIPLFLWGVWPAPLESREVVLAPVDMAPGGLDGEAYAAPLQSRLMRLEWPAWMRMDDVAVVRLELLPLDSDEGSSAYQDIYETHYAIAEARLELLGIEYTPGGRVSSGMPQGELTVFLWNLLPAEQGSYRGVIWLHLRFAPRGEGDEMRRLLSAQNIELRAVSAFGLGGPMARLLGSVGVVVGAVLGLDGVFSWLWRRITVPARKEG